MNFALLGNSRAELLGWRGQVITLLARWLQARYAAWRAGEISIAEFDASEQGWISTMCAMPTAGACAGMCWGA